MRETIPRVVYIPCAQHGDLSGLVFCVRGARDVAALTGTVRAAAREQAPDVPLTNMATMTTTIDQLLFADRIIGLLGADRARILRLVFSEVALLAGLGLGVGLPCGYGLGRVLESRLFGLSAFDPPTLVAVVLVIDAATALAGALRHGAPPASLRPWPCATSDARHVVTPPASGSDADLRR